MLISDEYRAININFHELKRNFGAGGRKWSELVRPYEGQSILDYGCGKGTLKKALGFDIAEYDPAIVGKDALPEPADVVVCLDVLEHIEPENLDDVLTHIHSLMRRRGIFVISCRKAKKVLPDGRNAHLIVNEWGWWKGKLNPYFKITKFEHDTTQEREVCAWVKPR